YVDFDRRVAPTVEDLAGVDMLDLTHGSSGRLGCGVRRRSRPYTSGCRAHRNKPVVFARVHLPAAWS
ncbi:MAG TPA: hypothetical protein VMG37_18735, partial [Solirubrobacteraceae bacterium]|nr:hypothetical protein [Solirubrobacteraceae bacterium]